MNPYETSHLYLLKNVPWFYSCFFSYTLLPQLSGRLTVSRTSIILAVISLSIISYVNVIFAIHVICHCLTVPTFRFLHNVCFLFISRYKCSSGSTVTMHVLKPTFDRIVNNFIFAWVVSELQMRFDTLALNRCNVILQCN